jgi:pimeloyl-ACP methyl ester carboxylesterase
MEIDTKYGSLEGTLTKPQDTAHMPAVLIIPGSGPTDRDGNDPKLGLDSDLYKIIAQGLADQGIASLRYDKRGVGASSSPADMKAPITLETYVSDVIAALEAIEKVPDVAGVFLLGHSEGGLLSVLAAQEHRPRGLILLATPGRTLAEIISQELRAASVSPDLRQRADEIIEELLQGHTVQDVPPGLQRLFPAKAQPYLISVLGIDPAHVLATDDLPTLILQGTNDLQTKPEDAERLKEAQPDATLIELPRVNHVMRQADPDRKANLATYDKPDLPIDPRIVPAITAFVHAHMQ